jgi:putative nucleotidyltransferase with HDIG domain
MDRAIKNLPVFPVAARRVLEAILTDHWSAAQLESIAGSDQALAAHLLQAANSWVYGARQKIATLPHAITYIGAERTCSILYSAALKPLFASPRLRQIWDHSLEAAHAAQTLGELAQIETKQAFLAGLVHDIGRLAIAGLPDLFQTMFGRLTEFGCESLLAERVLCGFSHAEAGARALRAWNFPQIFIDGVEFHHAPETRPSRLASLLYLVEQWTDSEEDVPAAARMRVALKRLGLTEEQFRQVEPRLDRTMDALRFDQ